MFEHLDHDLQPARPFADDPAYADVLARAGRRRRTRQALAATVTVSVLATGGVSGLALGGPESVHAPIGAGPLLALGDPRSTAPVPRASLTSSERTGPDTCPSLAAAGRPASSAAAAVAVSPAALTGRQTDPAGWGATAGAGASPTGVGAAGVTGGPALGRSVGTAAAGGEGSAPKPRPSVVVPPPSGGGTGSSPGPLPPTGPSGEPEDEVPDVDEPDVEVPDVDGPHSEPPNNEPGGGTPVIEVPDDGTGTDEPGSLPLLDPLLP